MIALVLRFRARFHPLHQARRFFFLRRAIATLDRPVWARLRDLKHPVRLRLVRHGTYIVARRSPEPAVTELLRALVESTPPGRFVDVGANFGYYGFLVKALSPTTDVLLVEPEPENVALLEATLTRAPTDGVALHALALSDRRGTARLVRDRVSGATGALEEANGVISRNWKTPGELLLIATTTLDDLAGANPVDIVKIDVEGNEEAVLAGASGVLKRDKPILFIECYHGDGRLEGLLAPLGYRLLDADRIRPAYQGTTNFLAWPPQRQQDVERACAAAQRSLGGEHG